MIVSEYREFTPKQLDKIYELVNKHDAIGKKLNCCNGSDNVSGASISIYNNETISQGSDNQSLLLAVCTNCGLVRTFYPVFLLGQYNYKKVLEL